MSDEEKEKAAAGESPRKEVPTEEVRVKAPTPKRTRRDILKWVIVLAVIAAALFLIPLVQLVTGAEWRSNTMLATYILSGIIIAIVGGVVILLKTARTRYSVEQRILQHREVHEYVILWNRPRWLLYLPTLGVSLVFGLVALALTSFRAAGDNSQQILRALGGVWVAIAVLNVLVEQFHMTIKVVLIIVPSVGMSLLLLHLVGYADDALRLFRFLSVDVPWKLYFMGAVVVGLVIFIGWINGLFHYMAITPNVADLQRGLTETGRQIKNADYDVDFDATDVVERWLFGFGRIIISFRDPSRSPMVFFVPRASVMDEKIRRVRSVTVIDRTPEEQT